MSINDHKENGVNKESYRMYENFSFSEGSSVRKERKEKKEKKEKK